MKKGWKIFWISCGVVAVLGITLLVTGLALGGNPVSMWNTYSFTSRNTYDARELAREITGLDDADDSDDNAGLASESTYDSNDGSSHDSDDEHDSTQTQNHTSNHGNTYSNISSIEIDATALVVSVETYDGKEVSVDGSTVNSKLGLSIEADNDEDGGELYIETNHKIPGNVDAGTLYIYLPKNYSLDEADFSIDGGILDIDTLNANSLSIDIGAGTATVGSFKVQELDIDCGAGQITLSGAASQDLDIKCGMGQVTLSCTNAQSDYSYNISCGAGSVKLGNEKFSGIGVHKKIDNHTSATCDIDCGMGDVDVSFKK
ncbi:DUF4097 family beta strand repeat-containing protein [Hespellia stercorisuis]|uniref:Putative adhesin n=1 Tax=Hespellia stercorisuis DSM 15480 TaxID=1121950 RepID=A0A1M6KN72_9FIRM|nr:DUF4097 family beta strand repeat-containing protein [Hespellia stercorisuis]SHJ60375.1 Putative adhesin [Hespellia stercorisuis DSM 15480]